MQSKTLVVSALALALTGLAFASAKGPVETEGGRRIQRRYGAPATLGNGAARTYVVVDQASGNPVEVGVALDEAALEGLPSAGDQSPGGAHEHYNSYILQLPAENGTPYQFVELDWNPKGHGGPYTAPHFDFHFYRVSLAERNAIDPAAPDYDARAAKFPAAGGDAGGLRLVPPADAADPGPGRGAEDGPALARHDLAGAAAEEPAVHGHVHHRLLGRQGDLRRADGHSRLHPGPARFSDRTPGRHPGLGVRALRSRGLLFRRVPGELPGRGQGISDRPDRIDLEGLARTAGRSDQAGGKPSNGLSPLLYCPDLPSKVRLIALPTSSRFASRLISRRTDAREDLLAGPIRGELLGAEHLGERASTLARGQRLDRRKRSRRRTPLLDRLDGTRRILADAHTRLTAAADAGQDVGPAAEWLLDNYHVVEEHIGEVRESLPRGYYRELPVLGGGPLAGYPRVYELAITLISHSEGRIDLDNVSGFVAAFQQGAPLRIGELWAVPAMLRLGLIENVRRMTLRTVLRLEETQLADASAARLAEAEASGPGALEDELDRFLADPPALTPIFVSRFLQQLRTLGGSHTAVRLLEGWISEEALTAEDATSRATRRLALTQVGMANSITSLRAVARMDWKTFVESQSRLEAVLREDPSGFYPRMMFATRDRYRHAVERIAKRTRRPEEAVARQAVELATAAATGPDRIRDRQRHVGYYLIDEGLDQLERATGYVSPPAEALHRWVRRHPNVVFVGGVVSFTCAALAALLWLGGAPAWSVWLPVVLLGLIPANDIAVNVVNQLVTAFLPPRTLPKLDLHESGVPPEFRTAVVIPTLFANVDAVREALDHLEVQFLANREAHLHFAVLSDFTDAATEHAEGDAAIVDAAVQGVRALNARYGEGRDDAFYLFHRSRRWNPRQGVWMGWERKRGKLSQFNQFVLGRGQGAFAVLEGDLAMIRRVRYVITLDDDTVLPPDAAPDLVGALAHPLNRAEYDPVKGRVVRGYGILQPRVGISLPSANRSVFAAIQSGQPGVDPYTTAVSDVYQDLYGEGSFTGKGVYDVEAFERATRGRFPENRLLSHDLIEGSYARAGLATDVVVYDDYPSRYLTFTRRKHRWIRGDWQLIGWLAGRVPGPDGPEPNRLSVLSRWKLLDNLRRSTLEIAQLVFLVLGWTLLPGSALRWTLLGLGAIAAPWVTALLLALIHPPLDKSWRAYYSAVGRDAVNGARQLLLAAVFLPHQAWVSVDAIVRTLWRLFVSHRRMLEWRTASQTERGVADSASILWRAMWPAVAIALVVGLAVAWRRPIPGEAPWQLALAVLPLLLAWIASPLVAHALRRSAVPALHRLPTAARRQALRYALLHWRFFERFATEDTHWLAPDNYQEAPEPVVAMRTSPTNIGLQLLATVSAWDLGFIPLEAMAGRLELVLRSLERMRRHQGHFFNWYDLRDLSVLEPAYVSTVDSGNLAGHLVALRQACLGAIDEPLLDARVCRALEAAIAVAAERTRGLPAAEHLRAAQLALPARTAPALPGALATALDHLRRAEAALAQGGLEAGAACPGVGVGHVGNRTGRGPRHLGRVLRRAPAREPARPRRRRRPRRPAWWCAWRRSPSAPTPTRWRWTSGS